MMSRPPERTPLACCTGNECSQKLEDARGFERAMGKIPVVECGYGKHPDQVRSHCQQDAKPAEWKKKNTERRQVDRNEREATKPFYLFFQIFGWFVDFWGRSDPSQQVPVHESSSLLTEQQQLQRKRFFDSRRSSLCYHFPRCLSGLVVQITACAAHRNYEKNCGDSHAAKNLEPLR